MEANNLKKKHDIMQQTTNSNLNKAEVKSAME